MVIVQEAVRVVQRSYRPRLTSDLLKEPSVCHHNRLVIVGACIARDETYRSLGRDPRIEFSGNVITLHTVASEGHLAFLVEHIPGHIP